MAHTLQYSTEQSLRRSQDYITMHGLFEGARTIKSGQELPHELFKGAIFSRARSDQDTIVSCTEVSAPIFIMYAHDRKVKQTDDTCHKLYLLNES